MLFSHKGFNENCFIELYSEKEDELSDMANYHAVVITKTGKNPELISFIIRLEGMKFGDDNYLLTQRNDEILTPDNSHTISVQEYMTEQYTGPWNIHNIASENVFKPVNNIILRGSLNNVLKLGKYDLVIVILTYQLETQVDWRNLLSEDNFKFTHK